MSAFEILRERVPLAEAVGRHREVQGNRARCVAPDHEDASPSMHLYDDHVHCFSCGFHGDVVDAWAALRGFDRPMEAALDLAGEYGVELPRLHPEARKRIQERRAREERYVLQARACHDALGRHPAVVGWWEGRGFGRDLRERFLLGASRGGTAAVIPFWNRGRVQGLIRRNLQREPKYVYPNREELPAGHRPLFIPGPVRGDAFLVEGIVDALALAALGQGAVSVGGTSISEPQARELEGLPGTIYVLPDGDEEGGDAARRWVRRLYPRALLCPADYGGGVPDA